MDGRRRPQARVEAADEEMSWRKEPSQSQPKPQTTAAPSGRKPPSTSPSVGPQTDDGL